jgi:hypothetical protein
MLDREKERWREGANDIEKERNTKTMTSKKSVSSKCWT